MTPEIFPEKLSKIEFAICDEMRITVQELRGRGRMLHVAQARQCVWAIAVAGLGYSYNRLKRLYERDHTTIRHGVLKMRDSDAYRHAIRTVEERFPGVTNLGIAQGITSGQITPK